MNEKLESLSAIKETLNRIRVTGREDCYAVVAINNELDKLIKQEQKEEVSDG